MRQISTDVINAAKADKAIQAGDINRIVAMVEDKVMPHVNFEVVTPLGGGPAMARRHARAAQQAAGRIQDPARARLFRRADGGEGPHGGDQPRRCRWRAASQVVVQLRGARRQRADQARLPARQGRPSAWKIIDVNVGGLWLVQNYRSQFATELNKGGIDGLIASWSSATRHAEG